MAKRIGQVPKHYGQRTCSLIPHLEVVLALGRGVEFYFFSDVLILLCSYSTPKQMTDTRCATVTFFRFQALQEIPSLVTKVWRSQQRILTMIRIAETVLSYSRVLGGMAPAIHRILMASIIMVHTHHMLMVSTGIRGKSITIP